MRHRSHDQGPEAEQEAAAVVSTLDTLCCSSLLLFETPVSTQLHSEFAGVRRGMRAILIPLIGISGPGPTAGVGTGEGSGRLPRAPMADRAGRASSLV